MPKVAVFYDWLNQWGGAERVLLDILTLYPQADLFTLVHDPHKTKWLPKNIKITTSFINKLPLSKNNPILYTMLYPLALELFDFSDYDLLISTTSTVGHCHLTLPQTKFVCYFHNINRYLYQTPPSYRILSALLRKYQKIDYIYSRRPDFLFTNSETVSERIQSHYQRKSDIIHPGVDINKFIVSPNPPSDYFLVVSRLVAHKNIRIAIDACNQLGKKLIIVGSGRDGNRIKQYVSSLNNPNIKLLGFVSEARLLDLYQHCLALLCPQIEDFGLAPIEVQACGRPVIALNRGGLTETVIDGKTGVFFQQQTAGSLVEAIQKFSKLKIDSAACRSQAEQFSRPQFMLNFKQQIERLCQFHQNTTL